MAKKHKSYRRQQLPNGSFEVKRFDTEHKPDEAKTIEEKAALATDGNEEKVMEEKAAAAEAKAATERVVEAKAAAAAAAAAVPAAADVRFAEAKAASDKAAAAVTAAQKQAVEAKAASDKAAAAVVAAVPDEKAHEENLKDALAFHLMQDFFKDKPGDVRVSFISDPNETKKVINDLKKRMKYGEGPAGEIMMDGREDFLVKNKPFYFEVKTISAIGFQTIHMKGWRDEHGKEGVLITDPNFIGEAIKYAALRKWDSLKLQQPTQDIDKYKKNFFPSPGRWMQNTKAYYNLKTLIGALRAHNSDPQTTHKVGFDLPFTEDGLQSVFGYSPVKVPAGLGEKEIPAWKAAQDLIAGYKKDHTDGQLLYSGEKREAKQAPRPKPEPERGLIAGPVGPPAPPTDSKEESKNIPKPPHS